MTDSCEIDDFDDYEDFEIDDETIGQPAPRRRTRTESEKKSMEEIAKARAMRTRQRRILRRATSEQNLNEVLDWHFQEGAAYHVISAGDIDFMTYMRITVKQHPLQYALFSTWCMGMDDAEEIISWLARGLIKRCDVYVGENFIQHYQQILEYLVDKIPEYGGRVCMQRNHAKVMCAYWKGGACAITSSANINTNPRIEQTVITVDKEVADFYKDFFDSLKPKNPWTIPWEPWQNKENV